MREQGELEKEANSMHVGLKVTESEQEREDNLHVYVQKCRTLEPEVKNVNKKGTNSLA